VELHHLTEYLPTELRVNFVTSPKFQPQELLAEPSILEPPAIEQAVDHHCDPMHRRRSAGPASAPTMITPSSFPRSRSHANLTDTTLIAPPGWTNWSREAGEIDKVLLAIGSNMDEGHYAGFILDLDGNNIEAVYRESKTA
jgi:hypothetical protein